MYKFYFRYCYKGLGKVKSVIRQYGGVVSYHAKYSPISSNKLAVHIRFANEDIITSTTICSIERKLTAALKQKVTLYCE